MKCNKQSVLALVLLATVGLACNSLPGSGGDFTSASDKFSIAFPAGPSGVETKSDAPKFAVSGTSYSKMFDNRSDNYRSYEVHALTMAGIEGKSTKDILKIGLNGWDDEPDTVVKDITVNGQTGIDSIRTVEIGPAKMSFREVVFWSANAKKLYVIQIAATKKENLTAKEAEDFVKSFKITG
jgi:predicted small secreted protein